MSLSYPQQRPPRNNLVSAVITISVLVAAFLLLGIGCMWLGLQNGFGLAPTPTPTATAAPAVTPTPDSRATHVAEDMLTQVAYAATLVVRFTPSAQTAAPDDMPAGIGMTGTVTSSTPGPGELLPTVGPPVTPAIGVGEPAVTPLGPPPTAVSSTVYIPSVTNAIPAADAVPQPLSPLPVMTPTPVVPVPPPPPPLPVITPTPPPPPTATPLSQPQVVVELAATIRSVDTQVRVGPSNVYTVTGVMPANSAVRLRGRTASGDWIYACCFGDKSFWVRRAYVNIASNSLPSGAPQGSDPNDSRWLPIQLPDPTLAPRPFPTPIPPGDFPLARYDIANSGRVPALPRPPLAPGWSVFSQAAQPFVSPVTVSGASVLASSLDNQLYSLNLDGGNQRWRYDLQGYTPQAVSIQDGLLYLAYTGRRIAALQDQGNSAGMIWQKDLPFEPTTPFSIWQDMLFIGVGDGGDARLLAIRRQNPDDRREFNDPNARLQLPAIGQETIYVGADRLWALDINLWNSLETVWISPDVNNVVAPPVYAYPGVVKLAELFVADSSNIVSALDANTGLRFWTHSFGGPISALAVNENSVFVVGNGVLRALSRQNGQPLWTQSVGGAAMGGPLVTTDRVLVVTQGGGIFFFDAVSGGIVDAATSAPSSVAGGPAVSGGTWLFIPASNNNVYAYRGSP